MRLDDFGFDEKGFDFSRLNLGSVRFGKVALQLGVALALVSGTYIVATHGSANQGGAKDTARLIEPQAEGDFALATKSDKLSVVRTVEARAPENTDIKQPVTQNAAAIPEPPAKPAAASAPTPKVKRETVAAMPRGVERFDNCLGSCDTRDPMVVASATPRPVAVAPAPQPPLAAPPVQAQPVAAKQDESFLGLPPLPTPQQVFNDTVNGTADALGKVKQAVVGVFN